jgi:hypothetical protein
MKIIFHFNIVILKNEHLNVDLSKFTKNAFNCRKFLILQNGLQVNEILNFFYFQVNGALKTTCVLSNYACYNHNT